MEKLFVSLAYKYVALALMMTQSQEAMERLGVAAWDTRSATNIVSYHVSPPRLRRGGSIETPTHVFGFGMDGRLQFIQSREQNPDLSIQKRNKNWAKLTSLIDSNGAYIIATNWLAKLDVDVAALERTYPSKVTQEFYFTGDGALESRTQRMLPRFEVKWGTNDLTPAVWVSIFGPTKEPIHIRQEDMSFSRQPKGLVKDLESLLAITDKDFATYTEVQKSNLVQTAALLPHAHLCLPQLARVSSATGKRSTNALTAPVRPLTRQAGSIHQVSPRSEDSPRQQ